ncbi:hypothetical protein J2T17_005351 [Paenibacillus mucilaginosus]|uniref:hypothetical protein n=1 Tax=Paenibacillus mucilaginosus TaxID=61624 RepID=UPI003D259FE0
MKTLTAPMPELQPGTHCLFASVRTICEALGQTVTETELYFRCGGMLVEHSSAQPYRIGRPGEAMMEELAKHGDGPLTYTFEPEELQEARLLPAVEEALVRGEPVLLFVHSGCLDCCHEVYRDHPSRPHVICLYGLDRAADTAYIGDSFLLDMSGQALTYQGPVPLRRLLGGIYGAGFAGRTPSAGRSETVLPGAGRETAAGEDSARTAAGALAAAGRRPADRAGSLRLAASRIREYLEAPVPIPASAPGEALRYSGEAAYLRFFEVLREAAELPDAEFAQTCREVYYSLRIGGVMHMLLYLKGLVCEHPEAFAETGKEWIRDLEEEELNWRKYLLQLYKIGLKLQKEQWKPLLERGGERMLRLSGMLRTLAAELDTASHRAAKNRQD